MYRKVFNSAAACRANDIRAPAVLCKTVCKLGSKGKCRITPEVVFVAVSNGLTIIKRFNRICFLIIWQPQQETRKGQTYIPAVFRLPEGVPFNILRTFKD